MVYSFVGDNNGTAIPLTYQKTVFTKLAKINDTQFFLNTITYDATTASPGWDTIGNWTQNHVSAIRVNDTATSPVICFNLTLPADVSLASAFTQTNVHAMSVIMFPGAQITYVEVSITGQSVTMQVAISSSTCRLTCGIYTLTNYTFSLSYNAANLVNASSFVSNSSHYDHSVVTWTDVQTQQMSLMTTSIGASSPAEEIPAFPVEWVIAATATAAVLLARRKWRGMH